MPPPPLQSSIVRSAGCMLAVRLVNTIMWWLPGVMSETHLLTTASSVFGVWK